MLKIHFLNVGKGNCTVIKFPSGNLAVVDIDNSRIDDDDDILQDPIEFLREEYPNQSIFRFVLTHPDMDHMSGLNELHRNRTITNFWDTDNNKEIDTDKLHLGGYKKEDWEKYQELRAKEENPKTLHLYQDEEARSYWKEDGVKILGPSKSMLEKANETEEYNHCSYVIKIEHEGIKVILGGDATKESWQDILEYHGEEELKANVFLAPHHGSPDNIEKNVFKFISPQYVVVSDHRGHNYDYSYYNNLATEQVYSTKHFGNITLEVSDTVKNISTERNG
ncbi:MAG: hypothetical protein BA863_04350 [Desulfovibrio sp. S3730MH75]|nr:MAG: hypothetical protein BA863_04350 [Desulfovibrio sp. S3730MH75]